MSTIRTFIALALPTEAKTALTNLQQQLKATLDGQAVRWTSPENMHLTLHFLGDISTDQVDKINLALQHSVKEQTAFSLSLAETGCFPNLRRPRIIWVGLRGVLEPLITLQGIVGEQLHTAIGFEPETRPYSPHLTIGRVKKNLPTVKLRQLGQQMGQFKIGHLADLPVTAISLMQSDLRPTGSIYTRLVEVPLLIDD